MWSGQFKILMSHTNATVSTDSEARYVFSPSHFYQQDAKKKVMSTRGCVWLGLVQAGGWSPAHLLDLQ